MNKGELVDAIAEESGLSKKDSKEALEAIISATGAALKEIGEYAFNNIDRLKIHPDFELSVNGSQDWYEFTWKKD